MPRSSRRSAGSATIVGLFAVASILGVVSGALFAYAPDLAQIAALDDYAPNTITRVHARGGELIGEFAVQRRVIIGYDDIPEVLRQAIIASEDSAFFAHNGVSIPGIVRAVIQDVLRGELFSGASTLTMQLARNVEVGGEVLGREKVWQRKLLEAYYAIHLEKRYTKPEILALYANQVWLGTATHAADGVEAAAQLLFGKSARDVELGEAAVIAGIIQGPSRLSPLVNMEAATERRNYALRRMAEEGFITRDEAADEMAKPIVLAPRQRRSNSIAPYYLEEIRQHLEREYGARRLYHDGLAVYSTLDINLQRAANRAVADGLRALDKRQGYRGPQRNVLDGDDASPTPGDFEHPRWTYPIGAGDVVPAVVTGTRRGRIQVRVGPYRAEIEPAGFAWTRRRSAAELVERGDLVDVRITTLPDAPDAMARATLDQEPEVEAALLALDNRTGRVLAMVGGYDFNRSEFNRATQAYRQLGSLFKGVLYAAAIDQGYTPTSIVMDRPVAYDVGPGQPTYRPTNYDRKYEGPITLRRALEKSRNVPAVWMMDAVGPETVVDFARRVGFTAPIPPYLSVALGSAEATLLEVTSAYSVFPNEGQRMIPFAIERVLDREGNVLEANRPQSRNALRADTAYVMVSLMQGVVDRGTARRARRELPKWPVGGKTGTMDDYTDAWFVGFDPDITVGVWVGYDEKRSLGRNEEGARVALPIWIEFIKAYGSDRDAPEGFEAPGNILFRTVNEMTGELEERGGLGTIQEVFIAGTEPGATFRR